MAISIDNNPFNPGYGEIPPVLAGRDNLKNEVSRRLAHAGKGKNHPTAITLIGPRGCGKTALLAWITKQAEQKKLPVIRLVKQHFESVDSLAKALAEQATSNLRSRAYSFRGGLKDPTGQLGSAELEFTRKSEYTPIENTLFLTNLLAAASNKGLALLVDEAHDMPPEVGCIFYDSAQSVAQDHPIMLVIAGTPDLKSVLCRSKATFIERMNTTRIGRLSLEDTSRALIEPFGKNVTFDDLAKGAVLRETQHYPYFIQLWGRALWDVVAQKGVTHVGDEEVKEAHKTFDEVRRELYLSRTQELKSKGMLVPVAEIALRIGEKGKPSRSDFIAITRKMAYTRDRLEAEEKLLHTGFIWQESIGNWQYGIPSLATYVRKEAVSMVLDQIKEENTLLSFRRVRSYFKLAPLLPTSYLEENLKTVLKETNQENLVEKHLATFSRMGLLVPDPDMSKEHMALTAPLLTEAVIEKADSLEANPEKEPNQEPTLETRHEPDDFTPEM